MPPIVAPPGGGESVDPEAPRAETASAGLKLAGSQSPPSPLTAESMRMWAAEASRPPPEPPPGLERLIRRQVIYGPEPGADAGPAGLRPAGGGPQGRFGRGPRPARWLGPEAPDPSIFNSRFQKSLLISRLESLHLRLFQPQIKKPLSHRIRLKLTPECLHRRGFTKTIFIDKHILFR